MKNLLINGDFGRWTAGNPTVSATDGQTVAITDAWGYKQDVGTGSQPTVTVGYTDLYPGTLGEAGYPRRFLTVSPDGNGTDLSAASFSALIQNLKTPREAQGQHATLSFWARCAQPWRQLGVRVVQDYGASADSTPDVLSSSVVTIGHKFTTTYFSTWQRYVVHLVLPDYSQRSFGTADTDSLQVEFYLQAGSDLFSPALLWSGEVDFTALQLEIGTVATGFESQGVQFEIVDVPETAASPGRPGQVAINGSFIYVCPADSTWVRAALATFP